MFYLISSGHWNPYDSISGKQASLTLWQTGLQTGMGRG